MIPDPMTPEERSAHLKWCREFIEHHCVLRSPPGKFLLTSPDYSLNAWQFYLPVATLDQEFSYKTGLLFWDGFAERFKERPFQICGCETGGVPLVCALQAAAHNFGTLVNVFMIKKAAKSYGIGNWLEGVALKELPVVLVDDVVGEQKTMTAQSKRLSEFGLELYPQAFCVASCKLAPPLILEVSEQKIMIEALFGPDDFARSYESYTAKYGRNPEFYGSMR